jgi:hypothetical protein
MRAVFPKVSVSDSLFKKPGWLGHATAVGLTFAVKTQQPRRFLTELPLQTRLRLNFRSRFSRRSPVGGKAFARSPVGITRCSMLGRPCQRLSPRRHIGVTCGGSRAPMVGRCSRERRLIRSTGAPNGGALTGFVAGDREAGVANATLASSFVECGRCPLWVKSRHSRASVMFS